MSRMNMDVEPGFPEAKSLFASLSGALAVVQGCQFSEVTRTRGPPTPTVHLHTRKWACGQRRPRCERWRSGRHCLTTSVLPRVSFSDAPAAHFASFGCHWI